MLGLGYVRGSEHSSRRAPTKRAEPHPQLAGSLLLAPPRGVGCPRHPPEPRAYGCCTRAPGTGPRRPPPGADTHLGGPPAARFHTSTPCSPGSGRPRLALASTPTGHSANPGTRPPALAPGVRSPASLTGARRAIIEVCGLLADGHRKVSNRRGKAPTCCSPPGAAGEGHPPSESPMPRSAKAPRGPAVSAAEGLLENSVGAIGWARPSHAALSARLAAARVPVTPS